MAAGRAETVSAVQRRGGSFQRLWDPRELLSADEIERRARVYPDAERRDWIRRACQEWRGLKDD
jgi:hypothetical protein